MSSYTGTIEPVSSNVENELREKGFENLSFIIAVSSTGEIQPFRAPNVEAVILTEEQDRKLNASFIGRLQAMALVHFEGADGCIKFTDGGTPVKFGC